MLSRCTGRLVKLPIYRHRYHRATLQIKAATCVFV